MPYISQVKVDDTTYDIRDEKVKQEAVISTDGEYPVLLGYDTSTVTVTNAVNKSADLTYNPSTGELSVPQVSFDEYTADVVSGSNLPYIFRKTENGNLDSNKTGSDLKKIIGASFAWNQLIRNGNFVDTSRWAGNRCTLTVADNVGTFTCNSTQYSAFDCYQAIPGYRIGHKYLVRCQAKIHTTNQAISLHLTGAGDDIADRMGNYKIVDPSNDVWYDLWFIATIRASATASTPRVQISLAQSNTSNVTIGDTLSVKNVIFTDLTQDFGTTIADYIYTLESTNVGDGIAWFKKYFSKVFYANTDGTFESVNTAKYIANGFNQWNEKWEVGGLNSTTGADSGEVDRIRSIDYIRILPDTVYYVLAGEAGQTAWQTVICFYDGNKNFINSIYKRNTTFRTPVDAVYMRFMTTGAYGPVYNNDLCFNISNSRDGQYEPYKEYETNFDTSVELLGIPSLNADNELAYEDGDTYEFNGKYIHNYKIVDLGSEDIVWQKASNTDVFFTTSLANANKASKMLCTKYLYGGAFSSNTGAYNAGDKTVSVYTGTDHRVYIRDDSLWSGTTDEFSTAMSGVYLIYPLATPIVDYVDFYNEYSQVSSEGTQQFIDYGVLTGTRDVEIPVAPDMSYSTYTNYVLNEGASNNTDEKVKQNAVITTDADYPVLLGYNTSTATITSSVNKASTLKYNPSTGILDSSKYYGTYLNNTIAHATVDSTSTSTAFTATVPEITELRDGVALYLFNNVIASASGCTLDVNGWGAKPLYTSNAISTRVTSHWAKNATYLFIYNATRVTGGCWDLFIDYYTYSNTVGYQLRHGTSTFFANGAIYRYMLMLQTSVDQVTPIASVSNNTTTTKTLTTTKFLPYGTIGYYNTTTTISSGSAVTVGNFWYAFNNLDLRYSFNSGSTLTAHKDVYIRCIPQSDGYFVLDGNDCIVQDLPSTKDGKTYLMLGRATSTYQIDLYPVHPIYYYDEGLHIWTNECYVRQNEVITEDGEYPVLLGYDTSTVTVTNAVNKSADLTYNPSSGKLSAPQVSFDEYTADIVNGSTEPYVFRKTENGTLTANENGSDLKKITGCSFVWNQLVSNGNFTSTTGWRGENTAYTTLSVSRNVLSVKVTQVPEHFYQVGFRIDSGVDFIANHTYLVSVTAKLPKADNLIICSPSAFGGSGQYTLGTLQANTWTRLSLVFVAATTTNSKPYIAPATPSNWAVDDILKYRDYIITDLTQDFGTTIADYIYTLESGTAGAGVAWFKKYFPKTYYANTSGSFESVNVASYKSIGFNQFNRDNAIVYKAYLVDGGSGDYWWRYASDSASVAVKCLPNTTYCVYTRGMTPSILRVGNLSIPDFDAPVASGQNVQLEKAFTNANNLGKNIYTTGENATWLIIQFTQNVTTDVLKNLNVSISSSRDEEYEPYTEYETSFDTSVNLLGIPSLNANNELAYSNGDTYEFNGRVTRNYIKYTFTGNETWAWVSDWGAFRTFSITDSVRYLSNVIPNAMMVDYLPVKNYQSSDTRLNMSFTLNNQAHSTNTFAIINTNYGENDLDAFKAYIAGKEIIYELATPVYEYVSPYNEYSKVSSEGTQQFIDNGVLSGTRDVEIPVAPDMSYSTYINYVLNGSASSGGSSGSSTDNGYYTVEISGLTQTFQNSNITIYTGTPNTNLTSVYNALINDKKKCKATLALTEFSNNTVDVMLEGAIANVGVSGTMTYTDSTDLSTHPTAKEISVQINSTGAIVYVRTIWLYRVPYDGTYVLGDYNGSIQIS